MKLCTKCQTSKPESEFYRQPSSKDGLMAKCKECAKAAARANRAAKIDHYREYDKWRYQNDPRVRARHERYLSTERGIEAANRAKAAWSNRNEKKRWASTAVGNAVRDGKLEKPSFCQSCGAKGGRIEGHHDDYNRPLDVRWLCSKCHRAWHKIHGEGANAN